jgi:hypothetical protein
MGGMPKGGAPFAVQQSWQPDVPDVVEVQKGGPPMGGMPKGGAPFAVQQSWQPDVPDVVEVQPQSMKGGPPMGGSNSWY